MYLWRVYCILQASLASWVTILRIMGDLPDADVGDTLAVAGVGFIIFTTLWFFNVYCQRLESIHNFFAGNLQLWVKLIAFPELIASLKLRLKD